MLSLNQVNELFRYEPSSGKLFWRNRFNNKEAGTIKKDTGYIQVKALGKLYYAHRITMLMLTKGYDERLQVDHVDHNRLNNQPDNLRLVTQHDNLKNVSKTKTNTSGCVGVSYITRDRRFVAQIYINKKNTNLGYFKTFEEAVKVRKAAERKYGYHENHGL